MGCREIFHKATQPYGITSQQVKQHDRYYYVFVCICASASIITCMFLRQLTGLLRKHGRISKRALERSSSTFLVGIDPYVSPE